MKAGGEPSPIVTAATLRRGGGRGCEQVISVYDRWGSTERIYDKECKSKPGFCTKFTDSNSPKASYAQFTRVCYKWASKMGKFFVQCLECEDYMQIRNALIVLNKLSDVYPKTVRPPWHSRRAASHGPVLDRGGRCTCPPAHSAPPTSPQRMQWPPVLQAHCVHRCVTSCAYSCASLDIAPSPTVHGFRTCTATSC